jgi:thiosulfate/3-mercaptopyruvate sulfurtransferase
MVALLVRPAELERLPANARVVDVRFKLGDASAGRTMFEQGHIPGAGFVDLDTDLAEAPGLGGRHPLPSAQHFSEAMARAGIGDDTWVIAYDDGGAGAPRLWWLLRHFGHEQVSLLDGGYPGWVQQGGTPEVGTPQAVARATFTAKAREGDVMDVEELHSALDSNAVHLLDARAPERWRGEVEPVDRKAGRIPGALNAPSTANLNKGQFRSPDELRAYYADLGLLDGKPIVVSCGSGVSACVDLVGMELAGIAGAKLCPGSFSGWIAHDYPVATGPS